MNHYLVIAHRTAGSPELTECLSRLVRDDPYSAITLIVTAAHGFFEEQSRAIEARAALVAEETRMALVAAGVHLAGLAVGAGSPLVAAQDELIERPDVYTAIVLHTRPPRILGRLGGVSRARIEELTGVPVFHAYRGWLEPWRDGRQRPAGRLGRLWRRTRLEEHRPPGEPYLRPAPPKARELLPVIAVMCVYLLGGLTLALTVNRGFLLNDVVAIVVYTAVLGGLLLVWRSES